MSRFIVKVQTPTETNVNPPQVLIYNRSREIEFTVDLTDEIDEMVGPGKKKFFWANLINNGTQVNILHEADWQDW